MKNLSHHQQNDRIEAKLLTEGEEMVMRQTFKAAMLRAAAITGAITQKDVEDAQAALFITGTKLGDLHRVDRAMLASCHLRSCAEMPGNIEDKIRASAILMDLQRRLKTDC
jgi:hypothetical protein